MLESSTQELRALLFGAPPYERSGAPEPDLLADLAPVLPHDLLEPALNTIAGIGFMPEPDRWRTLAALLTRAHEAGNDELAARMITRLPHVVSHLPSALLKPFFEAVRAFHAQDDYRGEIYRAIALTALAQRLPEAPMQRALAEEALALARLPAWDDIQQEAFMYFVTNMNAALAEEEKQTLLAAARNMRDPAFRASSLAALLSNFSAPALAGILQEALLASRAVAWAPRRLEALTELRLRLPQPLQSEIQEDTKAQGSEADYLRALAEITRRTGLPLPQEVQTQSLPTAETLRDYAELADCLSEEQCAAALEVTATLWESEQQRVLEKLIPHLPAKLFPVVLARIENLQAVEPVRAQLLMQAANYLPQALLGEAAVQARQFENLWWRLRTLAALQPRLPATEQAQLPDEINAVASERLRELFTQLSEPEQRALIEEMIIAIWDHYGGAAPPAKNGGPHREPEPTQTDAGEPPAPSAPPTQWESAPPPPASSPKRSYRNGGGRRGTRSPAPAKRSAKRSRGVPSADDEEMAPSPSRGTSDDRSPEKDKPTVNTGFASAEKAGTPLSPNAPLVQSQFYYFWFEVSKKRIAGAIDVAPTALPTEFLPKEARLKVALFAFEGEIEITSGADIGEIQLRPDGMAPVVRPAARPDKLQDSALLERRLFFPVKMPNKSGTFRLRCNIYCEQVLVQSHLVQVEVGSRVRRIMRSAGKRPALQTQADYTLSKSLHADYLSEVPTHRLSLMLNDDGKGTHGFRVLAAEGAQEFKSDASFEGQKLQGMIANARKAMSKAAWGKFEPWQKGDLYRYEGTREENLKRLRDDMIMMAAQGYRFYVEIRKRLAGDAQTPEEIDQRVKALEELMRKPGFVQIASKESAEHVVPVAMLYDYKFDSNLPLEKYTLCPDFLTALQASQNLLDMKCFQGDCASRGKLDVICPSGFWGYRHNIGLPVSIGKSEAPAAMKLTYEGTQSMSVAVSTDQAFKLRKKHVEKLQALRQGLGWSYAETRDDALQMMKEKPGHVIYFYCHGGMHPVWNVPYLLVGDPQNTQGITRDNFEAYDIKWDKIKPLVFLNGCHTTALSPEQTLNLVSGFIEDAHAAGVIGTEITIFEPLACAFGEECLEHFFNGVPIGEAVRRARLKLLQEGNPLGLVYIPFVLASLTLVKAG
ncbi:hypothetical protein EDS67_10035 [candidate division KSB1 bacterium]|nr:MAG: hypothetical protein EDS67_10035 [candidate division KSB1 bacterium]MCE7941805.1 hypothetical protein [Chlorobi bacterium CHB1]